MNRRNLILSASAAGAAALFAPSVLRADAPMIFAPGGVAINGYDPVAYFDDARHRKGSGDVALMWKGATWHFASVANRDRFEADPMGMAPQFGGYCAWAVSRGYTASTDPAAWTIHDGRLYLNYSLRVRAMWSRDIPGNIRRGEANWPDVLSA